MTKLLRPKFILTTSYADHLDRRSIGGWTVFTDVDNGERLWVAALEDQEAAVLKKTVSDCAVVYENCYSTPLDSAGLFGGSPFVFGVRVFAPTQWVTDLREWLHGEHFDRQVSVPGLHWGQGFEAVSGLFHFFNAWGIDSPEVPDSDRFIHLRETPWFDKVAPALSASQVQRTVYRRGVSK